MRIIADPLNRKIMAIQYLLKSFLKFPVPIAQRLWIMLNELRISSRILVNEIHLIVHNFLLHPQY